MNARIAVALSCCLFAMWPSFAAGVYKCQGSNGETVYSDRQCSDDAVLVAPKDDSASAAQSAPNRTYNEKVERRFSTLLREDMVQRCGTGDSLACELVGCFDSDASLSQEKRAACEQASQKFRARQNHEMAQRGTTASADRNRYRNMWMSAYGQELSKACAAGDKRACRELDGGPASWEDFEKQAQQQRALDEGAAAACKNGTADFFTCEGLLCQEDRITTECATAVRQTGHALGENWYEWEQSWVDATTVLFTIQCHTTKRRVTLQCYGSKGGALQCNENVPNLAKGLEARKPSIPLGTAGAHTLAVVKGTIKSGDAWPDRAASRSKGNRRTSTPHPMVSSA